MFSYFPLPVVHMAVESYTGVAHTPRSRLWISVSILSKASHPSIDLSWSDESSIRPRQIVM